MSVTLVELMVEGKGSFSFSLYYCGFITLANDCQLFFITHLFKYPHAQVSRTELGGGDVEIRQALSCPYRGRQKKKKVHTPHTFTVSVVCAIREKQLES